MAKPVKDIYEYCSEPIGGVGGTMDAQEMVGRMNELGADGWCLVCFVGNTAVFMRKVK